MSRISPATALQSTGPVLAALVLVLAAAVGLTRGAVAAATGSRTTLAPPSQSTSPASPTPTAWPSSWVARASPGWSAGPPSRWEGTKPPFETS